MKEKIIKLIEDVLKVPAGTITVGGRAWCQHSLRRSH